MSYVTGDTIRKLREKKKITQKELADSILVSDKTVSKWETGKGLPDIGIMEELAKALGVSIAELLTGDLRENENHSANMKKAQFYVCPVCGNIITSVGEGSFSCCGINLPKLEVEESDESHDIQVEIIDHEYFVSMQHPMTKSHYISFLAYVTSDRVEILKLYPEQDVSARFAKKGRGIIYAYCNKHGLIRKIL